VSTGTVKVKPTSPDVAGRRGTSVWQRRISDSSSATVPKKANQSAKSFCKTPSKEVMRVTGTTKYHIANGAIQYCNTIGGMYRTVRRCKLDKGQRHSALERTSKSRCSGMGLYRKSENSSPENMLRADPHSGSRGNRKPKRVEEDFIRHWQRSAPRPG
jgi:hypothetical protein